MERLAALTCLNLLQGVREKIFWGVVVFFFSLLGWSVFLSILSVGESDRVLRGTGLWAMEVSGLLLVLFSFTFGFYRDRMGRMTEMLLEYVPRHLYIASRICAAVLLSFGYLLLTGLVLSGILTLHRAFSWLLWAGVLSLFFKLALALSWNLLLCSTLSSPTLAVFSTLFIYVAGEMAPAAFSAVAHQVQLQGPAWLPILRGLTALLPNLAWLDLKVQVVNGQLPPGTFFLLSSSYTVLYCLMLWCLSSWVFTRKEW